MLNETLSTEDFDPPSPDGGLDEWKLNAAIRSEKQNINREEIPIRKGSYVPRFRSSTRTLDFRRRFFTEATLTDWNDWRVLLYTQNVSTRGFACPAAEDRRSGGKCKSLPEPRCWICSSCPTGRHVIYRDGKSACRFH